jgi:hypothetical protein
MRTAQDIINAARFDLATIIVTLMRKLDAYIATGKKNLMTAPEEDVVIDFIDLAKLKLGNAPAVRVEVDNSYLDVEDVCHEIRPVDFIATGDDHNFYVSADGADIDADDLSTDELLVIAKVLENAYAKAEEK